MSAPARSATTVVLPSTVRLGLARSRFEVRTDTPTQTVVELTGTLGGEVPGLQVLRPTLEDVYLSLIDGAAS